MQPVSPAQLAPVRAEIQRKFGFAARFTHFPITGTCARCQAAAAKVTEPQPGED